MNTSARLHEEPQAEPELTREDHGEMELRRTSAVGKNLTHWPRGLPARRPATAANRDRPVGGQRGQQLTAKQLRQAPRNGGSRKEMVGGPRNPCCQGLRSHSDCTPTGRTGAACPCRAQRPHQHSPHTNDTRKTGPLRPTPGRLQRTSQVPDFQPRAQDKPRTGGKLLQLFLLC